MEEVKTIKILEGYRLLLEFENSEKRIYDMSSRLEGVFEQLKDYNEFKAIKIIDGVPTWFINDALPDNFCKEIDICPDSAYLDSIPLAVSKIV